MTSCSDRARSFFLRMIRNFNCIFQFDISRLPETFQNVVILKKTKKNTFCLCDISFEDIRSDLTERQHFDSAIIPIKDFTSALDFYGYDHFEMKFDELHDICKQFDININIYVGNSSNNEVFIKPLRQKYSRTINLLINNEREITHLILNEKAVTKMYMCDFEDCPFFTDDRGTFAKHVKSCKDFCRKVSAKQKIYGKHESPLSVMVEDGYLPRKALDFSHKMFACFDIETLELQEDDDVDAEVKRDEGLTFKNELRFCSVALGSNIPNVETKCFVRESSAPDSAEKVIDAFFAYLTEIKEKFDMLIPKYFQKAKEQLEQEMSSMEFSAERTKLFSYLRYLKTFSSLIIYGYNSSKFDIPVLVPYLLTIGRRLGYEPNAIKKGTRYINLEIGPFVFRDIMQLSSPCTLQKYLTTWGESENAKGIFPYSKYGKIEELAADCNFPPIDDFFSILKGSTVTQEAYDEAKDHFEKNFKTMKDWLIHYNIEDVDPFIRAIERQFTAFQKLFDVNLINFISLPSVASNICYTLYDKSSPLTWSLSDDNLLQELRSSVVGGLSSVFHRMINTYDTSGPESARFAKNGEPYTSFTFLDFNSLYLWVRFHLIFF